MQARKQRRKLAKRSALVQKGFIVICCLIPVVTVAAAMLSNIVSNI